MLLWVVEAWCCFDLLLLLRCNSMVHVALAAMLSRCVVCRNNLLGLLLLLPLPHLRHRRLLLLLWRLHRVPCCRHASSSRGVAGCCHTIT